MKASILLSKCISCCSPMYWGLLFTAATGFLHAALLGWGDGASSFVRQGPAYVQTLLAAHQCNGLVILSAAKGASAGQCCQARKLVLRLDALGIPTEDRLGCLSIGDELICLQRCRGSRGASTSHATFTALPPLSQYNNMQILHAALSSSWM